MVESQEVIPVNLCLLSFFLAVINAGFFFLRGAIELQGVTTRRDETSVSSFVDTSCVCLVLYLLT